MYLRQCLRNKKKKKKKKKKKNVVKSTDVVPAKYTPKVKLENFHNSRVSELGKIMRTLVCEGFWVFIVA